MKRIALTQWSLTAISLLSLALTVVLTFSYRSAVPSLSAQYVMFLFIAICFMGASAALLPSKCFGMSHSTWANREAPFENDCDKEYFKKRISWKGHHPTCERYAEHVMKIRGTIFCAGCMGLFSGALLAITGSLIYSLQIVNLADEAIVTFWTGSFLVLLGLIQYIRLLMTNRWVHYLLNTMFVVGTFLLLVGVVEINGTLFVEAYFLFLVLFWIITRMALSNLEHHKICRQCQTASCNCNLE